MKTNAANARRSNFFVIMGFVGLAAILIGFSKPFLIPVAHRTFEAPASIYVHGFLSLAWVFWFTLQSGLIAKKNYKTHMRLGIAGAIIAVAAALSLIPVAKFVMARDLQNGLGDTAYSTSVGLLTTGSVFIALVGAGMYYRKKSAIHKRLMLLATIVLLWPAWFRFRHFFPGVPRPDIWFGLVLSDSLIVVAWIWDKWKNKSVHPSWFYTGIALMVEQTFEVFMFDSATWRTVGRLIYSWL